MLDAARLRRPPTVRSARSYITGRFSSGSPPKNVSTNCLGPHAIELALDPVARLARRLERHLVGELVVVAVVALEAVVAREVALQRRQHRDVQLGRVALDAREVVVRAPADRPRGLRRGSRCPTAARAPRARSSRRPARVDAPRARSSSAATSGDTTSCASVSVFIRNTSSRSLKRHTEIEHRRLHRAPRRDSSAQKTAGDVRLDRFLYFAINVSLLLCATRVPVAACGITRAILFGKSRNSVLRANCGGADCRGLRGQRLDRPS